MVSELALKLIAENKKTRSTYLDLGNCGLKALPKALAELVWLEKLNLGDWWYEWIDERGKRTDTQNKGEPNKDLHDLALLSQLPQLQMIAANGTAVANLAPLANLLALQNLNFDRCPLNDLSPLVQLRSLRVLLCWGSLITDLTPLSGLSSLQILELSSTQVSDLTPLSGLSGLQRLYLGSTQVSDLTPLSGLSGLQWLYLNETQVSDLTPLRGMIERGCPVKLQGWGGIMVENCPLTTPPVEIVSQGNEAVLNYFRERDAGEVDHLYEAKMLILGEGGAGKTSLLRRLYLPNQPLPHEKESTKGIDIHRQEFALPNGRKFRLNVWDFGGQEIYHATHQFFLTRRSLYLLLDDTRKDHKTVSDPGFKDWLDLIEMFGDNSPALIFQNEKAGRSKAIGLDGIQARYPLVRACYQGNLEHVDSADALRTAIAHYAANLPHIGEQLPAKWIKVRADIEQRAQQVPYISQQEYFAIYSQHLPFDRTKALHLSRYFHDLGVFLHFQNDSLLARTVILQNTWATHAVYRVLDDEEVKRQHGHFTRADCKRLWQDDTWADMHPELLALMQRFELCYPLPNITPPTWFSPQLLSPSKPTALLDWNQSGDLVLRYRYEFMPKGIISRLMVRQHHLIGAGKDKDTDKGACLTCVLFQHKTSSATVELLPSGSEIALRARGPERKILLGVLANELDAINQGFPGLAKKVEKRIPCQCKDCTGKLEPFLFDEANLVRRIEKNVWQVQCDVSFDMQDVRTLLEGVDAGDSAKFPDWTRKPPAPRIIRIFLASSEELRKDRDAFELHFRRENDLYMESGVYWEIVRWENFFNGMSATRKQDDYNQVLQDCDIFLSLFATKAGKYTEEEFDAAFTQFKATGSPQIFTFFRDTPTSTASLVRKDTESLWKMQEKLNALGHFYTHYQDENDLNLQFSTQLTKMRQANKLKIS